MEDRAICMSLMLIFREKIMQGAIMEVRCGLLMIHLQDAGDRLRENIMILPDR